MNSINKKEIEKFSNMADEWWDPEGKFKPLHMFNPIRIEYILEKTSSHFNRKSEKLRAAYSIGNIKCAVKRIRIG